MNQPLWFVYFDMGSRCYIFLTYIYIYINDLHKTVSMFIWAEISFQNNGDKLQLIQWWNDLSKKSVWGVSFPDMQRVLYCFVIFYSMINSKINKMQKVMWAQVWGPKCGRGHVMLLLLTIIQRIRSICLLVALSYPL